jgi:uncharacterized surface protein with fasciclin (FAS1) repeats
MVRVVMALLLAPLTLFSVTSCSDEPDQENFYTFKGEMMSTYLKSRSEYSLFAEIVERAGYMNLLSARGAYTCFAPTNAAVTEYLQHNGFSSVAALSKEDCDTLARTHLLSVLCSTFDMPDGVLTQPNMNDRYLEVKHVLDENNNSVIELNKTARIYFALQDDSVENGIVHTISAVLKSSNRMLPDVIESNEKLSIFFEALRLTGLHKSLFRYKDGTYAMPAEKNGDPVWHDYDTGGSLDNPIRESARPPKERLFGYTAFIVPDSILRIKYGITKDAGMEKAIQKLYDTACDLYGCPEKKPDYDETKLTDRDNPLNKLIAYHLLDRNVHGYNLLTVREDIGIDINKQNPTEWYGTLLPHAMMKVEKVTVSKYMSNAVKNNVYINRRVDNQYNISGVRVFQDESQEAMNGIYFLIDGLLAYNKEVTDDVMNCRMRMDMSSVFPELMTNNIRMNYKGNGLWSDDARYSHEEKLGTCYYFPNGYLDGVKVENNGYFVYRRPRYGYWSYSGDEFVCNGTFDLTFRIPSVPTEGDYQIRLGYAAMTVRGIAQVYFDGIPQGIPLDMRRDMNNDALLGSTYWGKHDDEYNKDPKDGGMTDEEKIQERKELKNKGFYRGANGAYRKGSASENGQYFSEIYATIRIVLCTPHIKPGEDHYLRFRCVSEGLGNNEIMLDYIELVPRSVYGVTDEGVQEDDL